MSYLLTLNDDCLWQVLKYCDFKTKLSISQVCQRFRSMVQDIFKNKYKYLKLTILESEGQEERLIINGEQCMLSLTDFDLFLQLIHSTTEKLELEDLPDSLAPIFHHFNFTNTHELSISCFSQGNPTILFYIRTSFQNLRSLRLDGEIWVKFYPQFCSLENLELRDVDISFENLISIISRLKLKSLILNTFHDQNLPSIDEDDLEYLSELEILHLSTEETQIFLNAFQKMSKLREFVICGVGGSEHLIPVNCKLAELVGRQVTQLTLSDLFTFLETPCLEIFSLQIQLFTDLKKLTLAYAKQDKICLILSSSLFPVLEELTVIHCKNLNIETIIEVIKDAPQLRYINFLHCSSESKRVILNKKRIAGQRTMPLTIRICALIYHNLEQFVEIVLNDNSDLVDVTEDPPGHLWVEDNSLDVLSTKYIIEPVDE